LITLEEAVHNATNPDEFKMRVSGILSDDQAMGYIEGMGHVSESTPQPEKSESFIVKH